MHLDRRTAPAKLNLTLEVLAKRHDGFHALRSVVVPIALHDVLSWKNAAAFSFDCSDASLANDGNLVVRAAQAIGLDTAPFALHLEKRIPYGSGLGGGSSDAAAVLLAAMHGAFGAQPERDWLAIARSIGSDVPLFLVGAAALIEATGERVTALSANPPWWAVVLCPALSVSTREAYALLGTRSVGNPKGSRTDSVSISMVEALQRRDFPLVSALLSNDFEATMFQHDSYGVALEAFSRMQTRAHLSGSGSALFTLHETECTATKLAQALRADPAVLEHTMQVFAVPFEPSATWRNEA